MKYLLLLLTFSANAACLNVGRTGKFFIITKVSDHLYQVYNSTTDKGFMLKTTKTVYQSSGLIRGQMYLDLAIFSNEKPKEYMTLPVKSGFEMKFPVYRELSERCGKK